MPTLNDPEAVDLVERARSRFEAQTGPETATGCRLWTGSTVVRGGYGKVCILPIGTELRTNRVAWVLRHRQPIPPGEVIRHSCDNPPCVNPAHLLTGTQLANVQDAVERRRNRAGTGERHRNAKLTWELVGEIRRRRAAGESCAALAREFGVGRDQISRICSFKVWRNPPG
jgi:hypothetical protein